MQCIWSPLRSKWLGGLGNGGWMQAAFNARQPFRTWLRLPLCRAKPRHSSFPQQQLQTTGRGPFQLSKYQSVTFQKKIASRSCTGGGWFKNACNACIGVKKNRNTLSVFLLPSCWGGGTAIQKNYFCVLYERNWGQTLLCIHNP